MKTYLGVLAVLVGVGCAAGEDSSVAPPAEEPSDDGDACQPGQATSCPCPEGLQGSQVCLDDGSAFGECSCVPVDDDEPPAEPEPCGDGTCSADENCHTCTADCGTCEPCDIAPSCTNAQVPPANLPHLADMDVPSMEYVSAAKMQARLADLVSSGAEEMRVIAAALDAPIATEHPLVTVLREVFVTHPGAAAAMERQLAAVGMRSPAQYRLVNPTRDFSDVVWETHDVEYPGGTMECGAPQLRVAASRIIVHEEDDDFANDIVYCMIQSEAMAGAEIRITPQTPNLDEGDDHVFALEAGVFWGQEAPATPGGNLLITYDCFESDTSSGYQDLVNAIGQAAGQLGNTIEGENGWIFDTAAAIAPVVSTGLALDNDDHLFNAQQTIPLDRQLELTNGAFWSVRREGTHVWSDWDWELVVNVWGCAEWGTL